MISINPPFTAESAAVFAADWIQAWNARDLDLILSHYSWDVELISPLVGRLLESKRDRVHGLAALRTYFATGLNACPDLRFTLRHTYCGVQSLVLEYESISNLVTAEVMEFNDVGLVCRVHAHYSPANGSAGSKA